MGPETLSYSRKTGEVPGLRRLSTQELQSRFNECSEKWVAAMKNFEFESSADLKQELIEIEKELIKRGRRDGGSEIFTKY